MSQEPNKKQKVEKTNGISQSVSRFLSFDTTLFKLSVTMCAHDMHQINVVWIDPKTTFGLDFETKVAVYGPNTPKPIPAMVVDTMTKLDAHDKLYFASMRIEMPLQNRETHVVFISRAQQFINYEPDHSLLTKMLIVHKDYALSHFLPTSQGEIAASAKKLGIDVQWDLEYFDSNVKCLVLQECLTLESALETVFNPRSGRKRVSCFLAQLSQHEAVLYYTFVC